MSGSFVKPTTAMVLAAGLGTRMRPLTDDRPKPLIEVAGRTMLDRALDRLRESGIERAVVNCHYLGDQIAEHVAGVAEPDIVLSREDDLLLDTGGGVRNALSHLGPNPFYVVNADIIWLNGRASALDRLAAVWDDATMDALLLVHSSARAVGYTGMGDFFAEADGRLTRREEVGMAPFVYTGVQIVHPRLFEDAPDGAFSLNVLYDRAIEAERLYGLSHDGEWYHVGTPEALDEAIDEIEERPGARIRRYL